MSQLPKDFIDFLKGVAAEYNVPDIELDALHRALAGQTAKEMAKELGVSDHAIRKRLGSVYLKFGVEGTVLGKLEKLRGVLREKYQESQSAIAEKHINLSDVPDVTAFHGRVEELKRARQWIVQKDRSNNRCRLLAILGIGGIGKTSLAAVLIQQIKDEFDYVVWYSLRTAPPIEEILENLIHFLSSGKEIHLPKNFDEKLLLLIKFLATYRCLIALDNVETILRSGERAGYYRQGYEGYGELFRRVGEAPHNSCLILTSREKPRDIELLEVKALPVQTLSLAGLREETAEKLFKHFLIEQGKKQDNQKEENLLIQRLVKSYSYSPLALKIVATTIKEIFDGSIADFLEDLGQKTEEADGEIFVGALLRDFLDQQFYRLSNMEKQVMYWLAINREWVSIAELREDVIPSISLSELLETLESLQRRSLIEKNAARFTLQPVLMEYMTEQLIEQIYGEITTKKIQLLETHSLIKAQAIDYIRTAQTHLILKPIIDKLVNYFLEKNSNFVIGEEEIKSQIKSHFTEILSTLQEKFSLEPGYAAGNILNLLAWIKIDLDGLDCSGLTIRQAYLQDIKLRNTNFANCNLDKCVFTRTMDSVLSVAFSPDGKLIATGGADAKVCLWEVSRQKLRFRQPGHTNWVRTVAFSPDGKTLATGSDDYTIKLWDVETGKCIETLSGSDGHKNWVCSVAFSPDGKILASGSQDSLIKLWDIETGKCLATLKSPQGETKQVWSLAFSPDGKILANGSDDPEVNVNIWDVTTRTYIKNFKGHVKRVFSVAFSPDGEFLASGGDDCTVKLWRVRTGECVTTFKSLEKETKQIRSVAFSFDGKILASGSDDGTIRFWDVTTGEWIKTIYPHNQHRVWAVAFSPIPPTPLGNGVEGAILASGGEDQTLKLWDINRESHSCKCLWTQKGYTRGVWSIACSPDSQTLASGGDEYSVTLWNVNTGKDFLNLEGHTSRIWTVAFSSDGQILASGSDDHTLRLWDVNTGQCLNRLTGGVEGYESQVWALAFSHDSKFLAMGSDDHTVSLWDVRQGNCLRLFKGHSSRVWSVTFNPDGQTIASSSDDHTIRLWNINDGSAKVFQRPKEPTSRIWSVAFSYDGRTLVSGSDDGVIELWDVRTGKYNRFKEKHQKRVWSVTFSPDDRTIVSGSDDKTVKLWNVSTGKCLHTFDEHTDWVCSVVFSPDGKFLASGSKDSTIKLWNIKAGECIKTLQKPLLYEQMNIANATGLDDAQKDDLKSLGAVETLSVIQRE